MHRISSKLHNDPNLGIFQTDNNPPKFRTLTCISVHPCNKPFPLQFTFHTHQYFPQRTPVQVSVKSSRWLPAGKNSSCRLREGNHRDTLTSNKRICEFLSFLRHSGTTQHSPSTPQTPLAQRIHVLREQTNFLATRTQSSRKTNSSLTGCPTTKPRAVQWNYSCSVLEY